MYDWNETSQTVTIFIPLSYKIDMKKIESTITENYVKLNIPEMKIFKFIDLFGNIKIESSNIVVEDKKIIFYLSKEIEEKWGVLEFKTNNKEELKERRRIAEENYMKKVESEREIAKLKKVEFEKYVLDKSIKIDEDKRKELKDKKNVEKDEAEKELYKFINQIEDGKEKNNLKNEEILGKNEIFDIQEKKEEILKVENEKEKNEEIVDTFINKNFEQTKLPVDKISNEKSVNTNILNNNTQNENSTLSKNKISDSEIFDDKLIHNKNNEINNIKKEEIKNTSNIRQEATIPVNLTEKMIPHFAARESLSKEPPYPKSKKYVPEKNMVKFIFYFFLIKIF
jgi:hypothetical protein